MPEMKLFNFVQVLQYVAVKAAKMEVVEDTSDWWSVYISMQLLGVCLARYTVNVPLKPFLHQNPTCTAVSLQH